VAGNANVIFYTPPTSPFFAPRRVPVSRNRAAKTRHIHFTFPAICTLVLVQKAASETKRVALVLPACPDPTALFEESGPGQAAAPQTPDDLARPEAGEKGVCLPVRADPDTSDSRQVTRASKGLWEGCCSCRICAMSTKIAFWLPRCVLNHLPPAPDEVAADRPDAALRGCKTYISISCHHNP